MSEADVCLISIHLCHDAYHWPSLSSNRIDVLKKKRLNNAS